MAQRWYEQTEWSETIEEMFFKKLRRTRPVHASQYLRIQGFFLMQTKAPKNISVAFRLFDILFREYPDHYVDVMFVHQELGDYFYRLGDYEKSMKHFFVVYQHNNANRSQISPSYINFGIARNIIAMQDSSQYKFARQLIEEHRKTLFVKEEFNFYNKLDEKLKSLGV